MKVDLVIVGAGLGGLVAGIEARQQGATALVLEKLPPPEEWNAVTQLPGGNFRPSGQDAVGSWQPLTDCGPLTT